MEEACQRQLRVSSGSAGLRVEVIMAPICFLGKPGVERRQNSQPVPWRLRLVLPLLLIGSLAHGDVFLRDDGMVLALTNVPANEDYLRVLREEPAPVAVVAPPAPLAAVEDYPYQALVRAAALRHGLSEALLHAVIKVESNFNPRAVSAKGARGLMQLMPATARRLGVRDVFDPAANIDGGARYLKELLVQFRNDVTLAVAAYNAGPGAVRRARGVPRFAETVAYVPRVLRAAAALPARGPAPLLLADNAD
jgi:hypothetical protein